MRVKEIRLLTLISGDISQELYEALIKHPQIKNLAPLVLTLVNNNAIKLDMIGTEATMLTCESCGETFDIDDDQSISDTCCDTCGEGPFCMDCLETHICEDEDNDFED